MEAVKFFDALVMRRAHEGTLQALYRAAGWLRQVAKRSIKRRVKASAPGQPPHAHSEQFPASFMFDVDREKQMAVIGPMRINRFPTNREGVPVPGILEKGGESAEETAGQWFRRNAPPLSTTGEVAAWLQSQGTGPVFAGDSESAVRAEANGKLRIHRRYSPAKGRYVYLGYARLDTPAKVDAAAKNVVENFGYSLIPGVRIAPRPYMRPALQQGIQGGRIQSFWRGCIHK